MSAPCSTPGSTSTAPPWPGSATASTPASSAAGNAECDNARAVALGAAALDVLAATPRRNGEPVSLRWIMVHMVEEYARHNGHADLLRQCIDGAVGD